MNELGLGRIQPATGFHVGKSIQVYSDLKRGNREIAWFPAGLSIPQHIEPFLIGRGLEGIITLIGDFNERNRATANQVDAVINKPATKHSWLISWRSGDKNPLAVAESGFHLRSYLPNVIEVTAMIARAIFRQQTVPFASDDPNQLIFVRTSTVIELNSKLAVAFVPNRAIYFRAFPHDSTDPNLQCSDLIPVTLSR
ncbi:hypothetical protein KKG46_02270 [Patescibacteria group bacterium]|nr:hypothetical protein [Patescibacteria group bacterium]